MVLGRTSSGYVALVKTKDQIAAIEALRKSAYERAAEFRIRHPDAFVWTPADAQGLVLAAWDANGSALATMRGILATSRADAEEKLECTVTLDETWFPTFILERAATSVTTSKSGLNSLLRYYFIESALHNGLNSVLGAVFTGAPRLGVLAELGYQFTLASSMWDPNFEDHTPVHIVALPREKMIHATKLLSRRFASLFEQYPWRDAPFQIPGAQSGAADVEV